MNLISSPLVLSVYASSKTAPSLALRTVHLSFRYAVDHLYCLEASLVRAGSSLSRILQITVYLAKMQEFEEYDAAWRERFSGHPLPPRTTLFVAGFRGDKRIELTAIAAEGTRGE